MSWKKNNFISLLLCFFTTFLMGQVYVFKLSGAKTDYKWSDSISKAPIKLAGSDSSAIQTTTDSSGYFFDGKKIKRNRAYTVKTLIGQENKFTLSGTVTDCKTHASIKGVTIKLVGSDKSSIETKSDSAGNYYFTNCFKPNTGYVISTQVEAGVGQGKAINYGLCPYTYYEKYGYLNSSERGKISFADTIRNQIHDFCLQEIYSCGWTLPDLYFKKNSTDFSNTDRDIMSADTALDCFASILMTYQSYVFELSAHSSKDETNKKGLAEARAKKIYDLLISKGVDSERLVCTSYSDSRPYEFIDDAGNLVKKNTEITNKKSRRVAIRLLRKDYVPK